MLNEEAAIKTDLKADRFVRETEDTVIKIPDLMRLKIELGGGFNTDPK